MACVNNSNKIDPEPEMRKSITLALFALFLLAGLGFVESRLVSVQTHPQAQDPTVPALSQPWADDRFAPSLPAHEPVPLEFWRLNKGDALPEPRSALDVASALSLIDLPFLNLTLTPTLSRAALRQSRSLGAARAWPRNGIDARQQAG